MTSVPDRAEGTCDDRVYANAGNQPLLALVPPDARSILDVGCGAGDNAAALKQRSPDIVVHGLTLSEAERIGALPRMDACWVADVEVDPLPESIREATYDAVLLSHVLEHLRRPAEVVGRLAERVQRGGYLLVAVPNVLSWRQRWRFLRGSFDYTESGVMDNTHLHFYTYETAARYLVEPVASLRVVHTSVEGSVPLWFLRRWGLTPAMRERLDRWGAARWPNLFGGQILIVAERI